jgi:hypothetical protein
MTTSPHSPRTRRVRATIGATAAVALGGAGLLLASPASAHTVEVNFDGGTPGSPCSFIQTGPLRNAYAGLGVRFRGPDAKGGGAVLDTCGNFGVAPHSGLRFLAFNTGLTMANGGVPAAPEKMLFRVKQHHVALWVSQGAGTGQPATFTLLAQRHGHRVDRDRVTTTTSDWTQLAVHARKGIKKVSLQVSDPDGVYVADDLTFGR